MSISALSITEWSFLRKLEGKLVSNYLWKKEKAFFFYVG